MHKAKIIIIEDEFFAATHLKDLVSKLNYWVVGVYHSGEDFLQKTDWAFDAAIVDIFLSNNFSGLQVAKELKEHQKPFFFLTANQDELTLREATQLGPSAYISKPFKSNDVAAALEIIVHQMPKMLKIRGTYGIEELNPNDILYIKSDGVYIEIHTIKSMIVQRKLLKEIIDELPSFFIRVHRSYLVNAKYIGQRSASHLMVKDYEVPVSRNYRENLDL